MAALLHCIVTSIEHDRIKERIATWRNDVFNRCQDCGVIEYRDRDSYNTKWKTGEEYKITLCGCCGDNWTFLPYIEDEDEDDGTLRKRLKIYRKNYEVHEDLKELRLYW